MPFDKKLACLTNHQERRSFPWPLVTNKPKYLDFRSPGGVVKITTRVLKIGVQSHFHPISTVGFHTVFPENFGQAY